MTFWSSTNPNIKFHATKFHTKIRQTKDIIFCWVPSHVSIKENEAADQEAKTALVSPVSDPKVPAPDSPKSTEYMKSQLNIHWDDIQNNKLKTIVHDLSKQYQIQCENRIDEVVLTRLRISNPRLTHSLLVKGEPAPVYSGLEKNKYSFHSRNWTNVSEFLKCVLF